MKIKKISLLAAILTLLIFGSCKKETVNVTDLLTTVPSSASGVVVIGVEDILKDAGCKINDHSIEPSGELVNFISKYPVPQKEYIDMFINGDSGVEPKAAVVFYDSNRAFLTFSLYDVNKFREFIEKASQSQFEDASSGVKVNGNVAIKGAQAWVCLTKGKRIDADAIAGYAGLKDSQSFLVTPMGERLLIEEEDIRGWALLNVFNSDLLSRYYRSVFTMGVGFLFEDAESVKFKLDFKKGEMEAEAVVLNDKFNPAKYQLPSDKVDVNALKTLGTTCDGMMAFTLNSKLIKKFDQMGSAFGGVLFGDLGEMFKNVDGTIGIVLGGSGIDTSIKGLVTTKGEVSKTLKDMISDEVAPVSEDGKYLRFVKGDVKGTLEVSECADELKGSCLGIVMNPGVGKNYENLNVPDSFKSLLIKLEPESGGLEIELKVKTSDPKENFLMTYLRNNK